MTQVTRRSVPETKHVLYRFFGHDDVLLYVGITNHPPRRFARHSGDKPWWETVTRIEMEPYPDRDAVLAAERRAIAEEKPLHNVIHNGGGGDTPRQAEPVTAAADQPSWPFDLQKEQVIAVGLDDGECPVGLVTWIGDRGFTLSLMSFMDGSFGLAEQMIGWDDVRSLRKAEAFTVAEVRVMSDAERDRYGWWFVESALQSPDSVFYDTLPLGHFQTRWKHAATADTAAARGNPV